MCKNLLFYCCVLFSSLILSQTPTSTPNSGNNSAGAQDGLFSDNVASSINSPTAYAFKNSIQYPEVSNTGSIDISLPIYALKDRDLSLSVLLSYNPNVKVDSKASWVGTGWNLLATGAITRTVKDLPDDATYMTTNPVDFTTGGRSSRVYLGFLNNDLGEGSGVKDFPELNYFPQYNSGATSGLFNTETPYGLGEVLNEFRNAFNTTRDLEPDIYTFSFNNEHFDFVFNENGEPKILGLNDYKIEYNTMHVLDVDIGAGHYFSDTGLPDYSDTHISTEFRETTILSAYGSYSNINENQVITEFIITNPSGYKYYFDYEDTEKTQTFHKKYMLDIDTSLDDNPIANEVDEGVEPHLKHITAWYLSRIESPTGQEMQFSYNDASITDRPKIPKYLGYCEGVPCTDANRNKFQIVDDTNYDRRSRYEVSSKYISEIETDNVKISFQTGALREDSQGGFTLGSINVFSKISNKSIYTYDFDYSYTIAPDCSEALDPTWCKRLFLNNVIERHGTQTKDYFDFEYNNTFNLPSRFSYQQDFWGYYNANGANSLIPELYVYPNKGGLERYRVYPNPNEVVEYILTGADRSVGDAAILAGTLKKITFDL